MVDKILHCFQRAFAKVLGLSPGELSEILNGKRKLSVKKALHIAEKLSLNHFDSPYFSFNGELRFVLYSYSTKSNF